MWEKILAALLKKSGSLSDQELVTYVRSISRGMVETSRERGMGEDQLARVRRSGVPTRLPIGEVLSEPDIMRSNPLNSQATRVQSLGDYLPIRRDDPSGFDFMEGGAMSLDRLPSSLYGGGRGPVPTHGWPNRTISDIRGISPGDDPTDSILEELDRLADQYTQQKGFLEMLLREVSNRGL